MLVYSYHSKRTDFILWDVTVSYEPLDEYRRYKVLDYKRVRVLDDIAAELQENIKCINKRRSFTEKVVEYTVNDVFRFGKYANRKITEVNDLKYTSWYYTVIDDENHKKFIHDYLYENWYDFRINEDGEEYVVTPNRIKYENELEKKRNSFIKTFDPSKKYYLEPKHNPNRKGEINIDGIIYTFPKVREYYYEDFCYYLPVCNGHSKRVKNKVLECSLICMDNEIFISNFKVINY